MFLWSGQTLQWTRALVRVKARDLARAKALDLLAKVQNRLVKERDIRKASATVPPEKERAKETARERCALDLLVKVQNLLVKERAKATETIVVAKLPLLPRPLICLICLMKRKPNRNRPPHP